jgi:hypothetical protein
MAAKAETQPNYQFSKKFTKKSPNVEKYMKTRKPPNPGKITYFKPDSFR